MPIAPGQNHQDVEAVPIEDPAKRPAAEEEEVLARASLQAIGPGAGRVKIARSRAPIRAP